MYKRYEIAREGERGRRGERERERKRERERERVVCEVMSVYTQLPKDLYFMLMSSWS